MNHENQSTRTDLPRVFDRLPRDGKSSLGNDEKTTIENDPEAVPQGVAGIRVWECTGCPVGPCEIDAAKNPKHCAPGMPILTNWKPIK